MKKISLSKSPNMLIKDDRLSFAFRKDGLVLFSYSNALGASRKKITGAARSPVCAGLRLLKRLPLLFVQLCPQKNGAYMILPSQAANEATGAGIRPSLRCILSSKEIFCNTLLEFFRFLCPRACPRRISFPFTEACRNEN